MKTVVMTGATSGIGRVAADHILEAPDIELWVGARGAPPPGAHALPLDLARLANVHTFAQAASIVRRRLTWPEPSALAKSDDAMNTLWRDSARMVGLRNDDEGGPPR